MAVTRLAQETTVLAAARAALDPNRAAWQHDILVSTIIEVLGRKGPLSRRELRDELALTLVGQETNPVVLSEALDRAQAQDLLLMTEGRKGRQQWSLPEGVKEEAASDRRWAEMLLAETEVQVADRIRATFPGQEELRHRAPRLTKDLVGAMVRASRGVFDAVQHSTSPNDLREVRLSLRSVIPDLRNKVQPATLADLMAEMLLSAANPDEEFGNELLSTIVAGQILHGMVCRDDVVGPMPAARLILDTSQLLNLASYDPRVVELFESFLAAASKHGCELVITDRVHQEWDNHWQQADTFLTQLQGKYGDDFGDALKLHQHRVLREYGYAAERGAKSFESWAQSRRNLNTIIGRYSIAQLNVEDLELDLDFVHEFADAIKDYQEQKGSLRIRGPELRYTDGVSAAIVRANRNDAPESLVPTAWFVAFDKSSDAAYRQVETDQFPLVIRASTWLLHYAAFEGETEGDSRATFADRLSEDLILGAFLSVAASYTNDEMLELGDLLSEGDHIDKDDVRAFLAAGFLNPDAVAEDRVRDFARARLLRQGDRVVRNRRVEGERVREANAERDAARARIGELEERVSTTAGESTDLKRTLEAVLFDGALLILWLLATTLHWFEHKIVIVGWFVGGYLAFESFNYVAQRETTRLQRVAAVGISLVLAAGAFYLDKKFDP
jgi:hypothetical protein